MKDTIVSKIISGFLAGMMISIGGAAYLACYPDHKIAGAFLFCIGLLTVCWKKFSLYTGKIGLLFDKHSKEDISVLLLGLAGNLLGTVVFGYMIAYALPDLKTAATLVCAAKLELSFDRVLLRAIMCGVLIYVAVDVFSNNKSPLGVLLGIPAFILSGYEHSIADMFYFSAYGVASARSFGFVWIVIIGNSIGGLLIPALQTLGKISFKKKGVEPSEPAPTPAQDERAHAQKEEMPSQQTEEAPARQSAEATVQENA